MKDEVIYMYSNVCGENLLVDYVTVYFYILLICLLDYPRPDYMFMSRKRTKDEGGRKERKGKEDGIYLESHFFFLQ